MFSFWILLELGIDGGGAENWSYKIREAPVKSSPSTNQYSTSYRPDALPVTQPTASKQ